MNDVKYRTLLETLRKRIASGRYGAGKPFPSVRALIRDHGVSKTTVQRALDEMSHLGLISRKQGRGTFVVGRGASRLVGLGNWGETCASDYLMRLCARLSEWEGRSVLYDLYERVMHNAFFSAQSEDGLKYRYFTPQGGGYMPFESLAAFDDFLSQIRECVDGGLAEVVPYREYLTAAGR